MLTSADARRAAQSQAEEIERRFLASATRGDRFADAVATNVGSWRFIGWQSLILALWIVWNTLPGTANIYGLNLHWDEHPFIFLNLLLSFQAAYTAPFIMMSQNRAGAKDRAYAESDFETDVSAAAEIDEIHAHLDELTETITIGTTTVSHLEQLVKRVEHLEEQNALLLAALTTLTAQRGQQGDARG